MKLNNKHLMNEVKVTGGARIGRAKASWPFATLKVTKDKLELNASIVGNLVFKPSDIISIETNSGFLNKGLYLNHKVANYKDKVIFWTFGDVNLLLQQIEQTGFLKNDASTPVALNTEIESLQAKGGFPIKTWFAITAGVIWNLLFLFDFYNFITKGNQVLPIGTGVKSALGFAFAIALLLLFAAPFRNLVLKEGRTLNDIKRFAYLLLLVSGLLLLQFSFVF